MNVANFDLKLIDFFKKISEPLARAGIFIVFFWFGFLKIIGLSSASDLVQDLFTQTMTVSGISFPTFLIIFGGFECIIGLLFLVKGWERIVIPLLFVHMITTFLPLWFLKTETWSYFLVPTMTGQYIIKNLVIVALAIGIASHLKPLTKKKKKRKSKTKKAIISVGSKKKTKALKTVPVNVKSKLKKGKKTKKA